LRPLQRQNTQAPAKGRCLKTECNTAGTQGGRVEARGYLLTSPSS
jgi:hypothetical protein